MNKRSLGVLLFAAMLAGCNNVSGNAVRGSGTLKSEARTVPAFSMVSTAGAFDIVVTQGPVTSVVIEADDNILPEILTTVSGTTLEISPKSSISPSKTVVVRITHPSLLGVSIAGSGTVIAMNLDVPAFDADIAGSGNMKLGGKASALTINIAGSGDVFAPNLAAEKVSVGISGSGSAEVSAGSSLKANISGSGSVVYSGEPGSVDTNVSGSGRVKRR